MKRTGNVASPSFYAGASEQRAPVEVRLCIANAVLCIPGALESNHFLAVTSSPAMTLSGSQSGSNGESKIQELRSTTSTMSLSGILLLSTDHRHCSWSKSPTPGRQDSEPRVRPPDLLQDCFAIICKAPFLVEILVPGLSTMRFRGST